MDKRTMTGAANELRAAAWLLDRGFAVYQAACSHSPFDLVAYAPVEQKCYRVEVKTVTICGQSSSFSWPANDHWDMLLVVAPDYVFEFRARFTRAEATQVIRDHYGLQPVPSSVGGKRGAAVRWSDRGVALMGSEVG